MAIGDLLGNTLLGGSNKRVYTDAEQAQLSAKYPGIVWRNGVPYVSQAATSDPNADYSGPNPQYSGGTGREDQPGALVEADLSDPNFLAQLGRFAAVTSAAQAANGQFGGPSGASGATSGGTSAGLPTLGNVGTGLPSWATTGTASLSAPAATGVSSAVPALSGVQSGVPSWASTGTAKIAAPAAAAAAGGGWASWIPKLATVGAQVAGGLNSRSALKTAKSEQQAGTAASTQIQNEALQRSGDIYNQQRADTQNLFGQPFQTLGGLLGMNIAPIGPANVRMPTSAQPTGVPDGLNPNVPITAPYPGKPGAADPLVGVPVTAGATLKELAALGSRRKSQTSYGSGAAKGRA